MKHTIIQGSQGSGKTTKLHDILTDSNLYSEVFTQENFYTIVDFNDLQLIGIDDVISISELEEFITKMDLWDKFTFVITTSILPQDLTRYNVIGLAEPHVNFNLIRQWARQKGILDKGDPKTQFVKLTEEVGELAYSILRGDRENYKDSIGDIVVVLTSMAYFEGLTIEECIQSAYDVISKRTGKMVNNNFVKDAE